MANPIVPGEQNAHFGDTPIIPGAKPLFFVLILLGVAGLGVAGAGVHHLTAGGLSHKAIIMMAAGGVGAAACLVGGIVGMVKQRSVDQRSISYSEEKLNTRLKDNEHTYLLQGNGLYALVVKRPIEGEESRLEILKSDIDFSADLGNRLKALENKFNLPEWRFRQTALFPDGLVQIRQDIKGSGNEVYRNAQLAVIEDPAFLADPNGYLQPLRAQQATLKKSEKLADRAVADLLDHHIITKL